MMRIGTGFDVHRFKAGRRLVLGGEEIPYDQGLDGHSDADVLIHAVMDALLGSLALGDIGMHFPDTDAAFRGADSLKLLARVGQLVADKRGRIINIDSTLLAEAPRLAPHVQKMRANISGALDIPADCVSIKATTMEKMGFVGRKEGIAAMATACVEVIL